MLSAAANFLHDLLEFGAGLADDIVRTVEGASGRFHVPVEGVYLPDPRFPLVFDGRDRFGSGTDTNRRLGA